MGIRLKILLAFILCFGLMAGISLTVLERSMSESYDAIERGDIAANMGRVEQSFEASASSLKNQTNDWAVWNEMYRYALSPTPEWEKENIDETTLAPADLSLVMVLARNGRLLSFSAVDPAGMKPEMLSSRVAPYLDHMKNTTGQAQCGIVRIEAGFLLTCWAGIVPSAEIKEAVGTVIMGRLLDTSRLSKLREQTRLPFELTAQVNNPAGRTHWPDVLTPGAIGGGEFWTSFNDDVYHLYLPVRDILKQDVGLITLEMPRSVHKQGMLLYQQVRWQLAWTLLVVTVLLGLALHFMLIQRLRRFAGQIKVLENQSTWDTRIDVGGRDELGVVASNFNRLLALIKSQMEGLKVALAAREKAIEVIQAAQVQVIRSEKAALLGQRRVRDLLNNSGEGFLSFGADLVIDPEVSRACESMFGASPAGLDAAEVLAGKDPASANLFREIVGAVQGESDPVIRESMLSLLPREIEREAMLLKADYKLLEDGRFMAVLTDITEERRLEVLLQNERRRLEFIVIAVSDPRSFFEASDAFRGFLANGLRRMLSEEGMSPPLMARRICREIHTYKGLLGQFCFLATPTLLHTIETSLSRLMSRGEALMPQDIAEVVLLHDLQVAFDADLAVLADALGDEFIRNGKSFVLSGDQTARLENLAGRLLRGDAVDVNTAGIRTVLNEILALRKVTFKTVLMDFDGLVKRTAARLEKDVGPIEVSGGDALWIDPQPYQAFIHALVHVFRNAVVHGLEAPEGRWSAGKVENGKITCHVDVEDGGVRLSIADDGAGIDLDALRRRAVAVGIHSDEDVQRIPDEEVVRLIFHDSMSTSECATEFAGRGVGLAAVLEETHKLGGEVDVTSAAGHGTRFEFSLPLLHCFPGEIQHYRPSDTLEFVMRSVVAKTRHYFENEHRVAMNETRSEVGDLTSMTLLDLTAMISLGGTINLHVAFCFQQSLVSAVCDWMTAGFGEHPEALANYREAAVGEVVNTILGHCTTDLQHLDREGISMTPPVIIERVDAMHGMRTPMFYTQSLNTALGCLNISLVGSRNIFTTTLE